MLKVNEMFGPTIQGEGRSVGREVVFLRLSMCNLHCIWCDTPYTWNWKGTPFAHPDKYERGKEETKMEVVDVKTHLMQLAQEMREPALVISGGEPLLQQKELVELVKQLKQDNWWIEIETNGTISPSDELINLVDQFNCSPKLSNSQNAWQLTDRPQTLQLLSTLQTCYMKFVISCNQDVDEVVRLINAHYMAPERVFLMPEGRTREELDKTREMTKKLANSLGVNFSDRLHIVKFGAKRAV